jgi:hypothetical protein
VGQGWVLLDNPNDVASEVGVTACKLICKGGKDVSELPSVEVISGTEKTGTEGSMAGNCVRERLSYRRFPGAR